MKNLKYLPIIFTVIFQSCSSETYVKKGWKSYNKAKYPKAKEKFTKAINKSNSFDGYEGRAFTNVKMGNTSAAHSDISKTIESTNARYTYSAARVYALTGQNDTAFEYLCYMYSKSGYASYVYKSQNNSEFSNLFGSSKFNNYLKGYRRVKISVPSAIANWNESKLGIFSSPQDQFVVIAAELYEDNNKRAVIVTPEISDNNNAIWDNKYVIFDYKLGTQIDVIHFDADVTEYELLTSRSLYFRPGSFKTSDGGTYANFTMSDTENYVYSSGTKLPSKISWNDLWTAYRIYSAVTTIDKLLFKK